MTWAEVNVLVRNIHPKREITETDKQFIEFNDNEECEIEKYILFCKEKKLFRLDAVQKFFEKKNDSIEFILENIREINEKIENVLDACEGNILSLSLDDWEGKLEDVAFGIRGKSAEKAYQLWKLLFSEFSLLKSWIH